LEPTNISQENCEICGGAFGRILQVREMMFGMREEFIYCQCESCNCLQIKNIPKNMEQYYPANYYSYDLPNHSALKRQRRGSRRRCILTWPSALVPLLRLLSPSDGMFYIYRQMEMRLTSRVLDVGAGSGTHVLELRDAGIKEAIGMDPFIDNDMIFEGKRLVQKANIGDLAGTYDFITFHHSLEHMPHQIETLAHARRLLATRGQVLIRIPTVTSEAFETYQENWVNLDAPRHFFLHTHKSLELTASRAGLSLKRLWCDSSAMQFMGSEQYLKDIPLTDPRSVAKTKSSNLFTRAQRRAYERRAAELNRALRGDMICAVFHAA
jgi:SAM-dependent methyltransferase